MKSDVWTNFWDLCAPPQYEILSAVKKQVIANEAKFLFVATDNNPMITEFKEMLDPLNVSRSLTNLHLT